MSDFRQIRMSPLMTLAILGLVVACIAGFSGLATIQDNNPKYVEGGRTALKIGGIGLMVSVLCFAFTWRKWRVPDDEEVTFTAKPALGLLFAICGIVIFGLSIVANAGPAAMFWGGAVFVMGCIFAVTGKWGFFN